MGIGCGLGSFRRWRAHLDWTSWSSGCSRRRCFSVLVKGGGDSEVVLAVASSLSCAEEPVTPQRHTLEFSVSAPLLPFLD
jgi:hypothetical protein